MDGAVRSGRGRGTCEDAHTTVTTEYAYYNLYVHNVHEHTHVCIKL